MKPIELLFTFRGRIPRMPFFLGSLAIGATWLFLVMIGIIAALGMTDMDGAYGMDQLVRLFSAGAMVFLLMSPFFLALAYSNMCLVVKRLHDLGASGWFALPLIFGGFMLLPLIMISPDVFVATSNIFSLVQLVGYLVLLFAPGQSMSNAYGEISR